MGRNKIYHIKFNEFGHNLDLVARDVIDAAKKSLKHVNTIDTYAVDARRKPRLTDIDTVEFVLWID